LDLLARAASCGRRSARRPTPSGALSWHCGRTSDIDPDEPWTSRMRSPRSPPLHRWCVRGNGRPGAEQRARLLVDCSSSYWILHRHERGLLRRAGWRTVRRIVATRTRELGRPVDGCARSWCAGAVSGGRCSPVSDGLWRRGWHIQRRHRVRWLVRRVVDSRSPSATPIRSLAARRRRPPRARHRDHVVHRPIIVDAGHSAPTSRRR